MKVNELLTEETGDKKFDGKMSKIVKTTPEAGVPVRVLRKELQAILKTALSKFEVGDDIIKLESVKKEKKRYFDVDEEVQVIFHFFRHTSDKDFVRGVKAAVWIIEQIEAKTELGFKSMSTFTGSGGSSFKSGKIDTAELTKAIRNSILLDLTFKYVK